MRPDSNSKITNLRPRCSKTSSPDRFKIDKDPIPDPRVSFLLLLVPQSELKGAQTSQAANQYGKATYGMRFRARSRRGSQSFFPTLALRFKSSQQVAASSQPMNNHARQPSQPPITDDHSASGSARVGASAPHISINPLQVTRF